MAGEKDTGVKKEIGRNPILWLVFFLAGGMLLLVNNLEMSFARTLISCDMPAQKVLAEGELWSGSGKCGNRSLVINEGTMLSSQGQSQESMAKLLMIITAAVSSDVYGRKPVLLVGLACTTLSCLLFMIAAVVDSWARALFVMGQGLQGAFPSTLLGSLVVADLAARADTDTADTYSAGAYVAEMGKIVFGLTAFVFQLFDFVDYLPVWTAVFLVNCATFYLALRYCPETKVGTSEVAKLGVLGGTLHEIREYGKLIVDEKHGWTIQMLLVGFVFESLANVGPLAMPMQMAYHTMTMPRTIMYLFPVTIVAGICMPFVGALCRKHGFKNGWLYALAIGFLAAPIGLCIPILWFAYFAQVYLLGGLLSGFGALKKAIDQKVLQDRVTKFIGLHSILGYGLTIVGAPLYAWLFDAGATTYVAKVRPFFFSFTMALIHAALIFAPFTGVVQTAFKGCEMIEQEKAMAAAAAAKKTDAPTDDKAAEDSKNQ